MPTLLSLQANAPAHQDDAVSGIKPCKTKPQNLPSTPPEPFYPQSTLTLSFAFDSVTKSLNVVMTDPTSGEVVRKMAYTRLPVDVHNTDKFHGLLLDQFA